MPSQSFRLGAAGITLAVTMTVVGARAHAQSVVEPDPLATIQSWCVADGHSEADCACATDAFDTQVATRASSVDVAMFAGLAHTGGPEDPTEMMGYVQSMSPAELREAGMLAAAAAPALEACLRAPVVDAEESGSAEASGGDTLRARFIRQCASENGQTTLCGCIADEALEELSEYEVELMVDMRAAEARDEDPVAALARDRGMTEEEVKQGLAPLTGRIAAAMSAIDPVSCIGPGQ